MPARVRRSYFLGRIGFYGVFFAITGLGVASWHVQHRVPAERNLAGRDVGADGKSRPTQAELNNNRIAELGLIPDFSGLAVAYPWEVEKLVAPDGSFRTDTAFTVLVGTLSESAQARARAVRARMIREGSGPKVVALDFTVERVTFTVDDLTHPNERQNAILDAISRSAREVMPQVGEKIRAVGAPAQILNKGHT